MKKLLQISILVIITSVLSACSTTFRAGDFTIVSTKNINLNSGKLTLGERVKGVDSSYQVVYMKNAVDKAIETDRCAVGLADAVISIKRNLFTVEYIAEGTQILDKSLSGCSTK